MVEIVFDLKNKWYKDLSVSDTVQRNALNFWIGLIDYNMFINGWMATFVPGSTVFRCRTVFREDPGCFMS
jgi:hypothetical protein